ncbi:MAG: HlyD family efflux transporter periplasmic adaptor subunit [Proteobacteria bacterium]|nr:HlyD family efflux transporter periplasmic adaptor subunit [Pseudomonadota bacterium]
MRLKKRRESFIKSPEELERKRIPWGKYIYLGIFVLIGIGLLKWGYYHLVYIQGVGVLDAETTNVEAKFTDRVVDIKCNINDKVSKGDPLIFLDKSELEYKIATKEREFGERSNILKQKIKDVESEINLLEEEEKNRVEEARYIKREHERVKDLLALEVITRPQFLIVGQNLKLAERDLSSLLIKLTSLTKKLAAIKEEYNDYSDKAGKEIKRLHDFSKETVLLAPRHAVVTMIYKQVGEIAQAGEPILELAETPKNFITAYFDESNENAIKLGGQVHIIFENGDKSTGKIRKIYPATHPLPPEYRKQYGRKEKSLVAEIVPITGEYWSKLLGTKSKILLKRN